ncbi:32135_t:CDS:2, partial [Gigaspora margarita]
YLQKQSGRHQHNQIEPDQGFDKAKCEKKKGIIKQLKLSAQHGFSSTSMKKKQPHKTDIGPHNGSGSGSSKEFINT